MGGGGLALLWESPLLSGLPCSPLPQAPSPFFHSLGPQSGIQQAPPCKALPDPAITAQGTGHAWHLAQPRTPELVLRTKGTSQPQCGRAH